MQHLDEGTIHAWLDGALTAEEAARVGRHASECAECAALMAEARGLVAGASRILSALDDIAVSGRVPATMQQAGAAGGEERGRLAEVGAQRDFRRRPLPAALRPFWLAAAATVVLMAGSAVVLNRAGGPASRAVDTIAAVAAPTTEAAVPAAGPEVGTGVPAGTAPARPRVGAVLSSHAQGDSLAADAAREGRGVAPTDRLASRTTEVVSAIGVTRGDAAGRAAAGARRDASANLAAEGMRGPPAPVSPAADYAVAQRRASEAPIAPPTPAPAAAPGEAARKAAVPTAVLERSDARVRGAPARARLDEMRADTVAMSRVDTVVVEPPAPPSLRGAGRAAAETRAFPVTGCYEVLEGRLPRFLTLTATPVWSGAAEQRFVANAPGATGYWSQPSSGDVHLVIAGALVTARIDPSTGELRGKAQRGGKSETFVARRGCR